MPGGAFSPPGSAGSPPLANINGVKAIVLPKAAKSFFLYQEVLPDTYSNATGLTFQFAMSGKVTGNVVMQVEVCAFTSDASTFTTALPVFSTAVTFTVSLSATVGQMVYSSSTFAKGTKGTRTDGAVATNALLFRWTRLPANVSDTATDDAYLHAITVSET